MDDGRVNSSKATAIVFCLLTVAALSSGVAARRMTLHPYRERHVASDSPTVLLSDARMSATNTARPLGLVGRGLTILVSRMPPRQGLRVS